MRDLLDTRETDPALYAEYERYVGTYFPAYRDGHLLVAGGLADQPARYNAMIRLMSDLAAQVELKHLELTKEESA